MTLKKAAHSQVGDEVVHQMYDELVKMKTNNDEINSVIAVSEALEQAKFQNKNS